MIHIPTKDIRENLFLNDFTQILLILFFSLKGKECYLLILNFITQTPSVEHLSLYSLTLRTSFSVNLLFTLSIFLLDFMAIRRESSLLTRRSLSCVTLHSFILFTVLILGCSEHYHFNESKSRNFVIASEFLF